MFATLLQVLNYHRAVARIAHLEVELWLHCLAEKIGADLSDSNAKRILNGFQPEMPEHIWKSLMADWRRVHHS